MLSAPMIPVQLVRVVLREHSDQQWIFLEEAEPAGAAPRGFPIVIGFGEASEIHRVLTAESTARPMTHQLMVQAIRALGSSVVGVDIVDLRANTFYAQLRLAAPANGDATAAEELLVDARPSDALALALRTGAEIRVAESVLEQVRTDQAKDALPPGTSIEAAGGEGPDEPLGSPPEGPDNGPDEGPDEGRGEESGDDEASDPDA